jgi:hypothetical protein
MWVYMRKKTRECCRYIYALFSLRKRCHYEPTMALTLDDDRQGCVLYIYISICVHT